MRRNRSLRTSASIALGGFPSSSCVPPPTKAMRCFVANAAEHSSKSFGEYVSMTLLSARCPVPGAQSQPPTGHWAPGTGHYGGGGSSASPRLIPAQPRRRKDFPRVEEHFRIERAAHHIHGCQVVGGEHGGHVRRFVRADAVLAGDRRSDARAGFEDLGGGLLGDCFRPGKRRIRLQ